MKIPPLAIILVVFSASVAQAAVLPDLTLDDRDVSIPAEHQQTTETVNIPNVLLRSDDHDDEAVNEHTENVVFEDSKLWKRRGGGGGGRGGGGGGISSGSGSSSSGTYCDGGKTYGNPHGSGYGNHYGNGHSSGYSNFRISGYGSRGGSSSSSSKEGSVSSSSPRTYGGGSVYAGGSSSPIRSGTRTKSGISPIFFGLGTLAFWPLAWSTSAYLYYYNDDFRYHFHNQSSNANESLSVLCACAEYSLCGCDENNSTTYLDSLVNNGSYASLDKNIASVAEVNSTKTLLVNGTLSNDTSSGAIAVLRTPQCFIGYWPVAAASLAAAYLL